MALVHELDAKVVNNEDEDNRAPLVSPQARGGVALVVAVFVQSLGGEVVCKFTHLLKAVDSLDYFEVDPAVVCEGGEVVFIDEFLRDDSELNAYILGSIEGRAQIKVGCIKAGKFGLLCGQDAVEEQLDELK